MQAPPARASIENILCCNHLRRKRRRFFDVSLTGSCIIHAEIVLNYISIPNHVFLSNRSLGLAVFTVLNGSARERKLSGAVHLTDLI